MLFSIDFYFINVFIKKEKMSNIEKSITKIQKGME